MAICLTIFHIFAKIKKNGKEGKIMARISFSFGGGGHNRPPREPRDRHHHHAPAYNPRYDKRRHHGPIRGGYETYVYSNGVRVTTKGSPLVLGIIFIIVAAALIVGGIFTKISHAEKLETYQPINATITDYIERVDYDDDGYANYTYYPIYTFEVDGNRYVVDDNIGSSAFPDIGTKKLILYNPANPNEIIHANDTAGTFLIVFGVVFGGIAVILIVCSAVNKKKRQEYLREQEERFDSAENREPVKTNFKSGVCSSCGSAKVSGHNNCPYCGTHY